MTEYSNANDKRVLSTLYLFSGELNRAKQPSEDDHDHNFAAMSAAIVILTSLNLHPEYRHIEAVKVSDTQVRLRMGELVDISTVDAEKIFTQEDKEKLTARSERPNI